MLDNDPIARHLIATALGKAADKAVRDHIPGITQEAPLTARIGQALEQSIDGSSILGHHIRVVTQDIPDRGPGALERHLGADLYIGIEVFRGRRRESKGLLIQSKIRRNLATSAQRQVLRDACDAMLDRSEASYVWLYGSNGIRVVDARQIINNNMTPPLELPARRATTLFNRTFECTEGAIDLGLPAVSAGKMRIALGAMLKELRVPRAVAVTVDNE